MKKFNPHAKKFYTHMGGSNPEKHHAKGAKTYSQAARKHAKSQGYKNIHHSSAGDPFIGYHRYMPYNIKDGGRKYGSTIHVEKGD